MKFSKFSTRLSFTHLVQSTVVTNCLTALKSQVDFAEKSAETGSFNLASVSDFAVVAIVALTFAD